jgi:hypothetical protein
MKPLAWSAIGGGGAVASMVVVFPAFRQSACLGLIALAVTLGGTLWVSTALAPVELIDEDSAREGE